MKAFLNAAAGLALASLAAVPAHSQQKFDSETYFDGREISCPNAAACELLLSTVDEPDLLVRLSQASCLITLSNAAKIGDLRLRRRRGADIIAEQTLAPIHTLPVHGTTTRYVLNTSTFLAVRSTERPAIHLSLRGGAVAAMTLNCTVHGTFVELE